MNKEQLEELQIETQSRYDNYLYETEGRGISYGEVAYIQGLNEKELNEFNEELDEAERGE